LNTVLNRKNIYLWDRPEKVSSLKVCQHLIFVGLHSGKREGAQFWRQSHFCRSQ